MSLLATGADSFRWRAQVRTSSDLLTVTDKARHDQLTRVVIIPMASVGTSEAPPRPGTTTSRDLLTVKDEARHDRLTRVTNSLEEVSALMHLEDRNHFKVISWHSHRQKILTDWRKLAFKACDDFVSAYWGKSCPPGCLVTLLAVVTLTALAVCRQDSGLMVVFKCQGENA